MRKSIQIVVLLGLGSLLSALSAAGQAYTFNVFGLVGAGGSLDESDAGFGNPAWQLGFSNNIEEKTHFGVRVGGMSWGSSDRVGDLVGPSLLYVTLAGEYRETSGSFSGSLLDSGIYIGLGYYSLDGSLPENGSESESGPGFVVGLTGDVPLTKSRRFALRIEFAGHYADLSSAKLFGLAQLGLAYRF